MARFFERRRAFDLAVTLLVVILAVSVADIDDYHMLSQAMCTPVTMPLSLDATAEISSTASDSGSDSEHVCACLLCNMILSNSFGIRGIPPSAGKLSTSFVAGLAGSPHLPEVFHPPSV